MTGRTLINIVGNRYGKWLVLERIPGADRHHHVRYSCRCDCGVVTSVIGQSLRRGDSRACGKCAQKEAAAKRRGALDRSLLESGDGAYDVEGA